MSPETLSETQPILTDETIAQLSNRELTAVDHCDITDIQAPVLHMLRVESIMTRQDLAEALLSAEPQRRTLATVMLMEGIRDDMKEAVKKA
jgi:hypothetical protein